MSVKQADVSDRNRADGVVEPQSAGAKRIIFFDLDGTLHQQDMFGSFLRFLLRHLPLNLLLVIPLLPLIGVGLLVGGGVVHVGR